MEDSDNSTLVIVVVIFIVFIFLTIIGVVIYFSFGDDIDILGTITGGETGGGTGGITADERLEALLGPLREAHNNTISNFNQTATENGFQEFTINIDSQLKPNEISTIEVINVSGVRETVQVCSNNNGFQPLYIANHLVCSNGMVEITNNSVNPPLKCCRYNMDFENMPNQVVPETLATHAFNAINTVEGALGFCGNASGAEEECALPLKYKAMGAALMGAFMKKDWFKSAYRSAKAGLGEGKALASMSDFVTTSVAVKKETTTMAKATTTSAGKSAKSRAKFTKFKEGFFKEQKQFVKELEEARVAAEEARTALREAREAERSAEQIARLIELSNKLGRTYFLKGLAKPGAKAFGKEVLKGMAKIIEVDAVVGAACSAAIGWTGVGELACGGLIVALDVAMVVDMAAALLDECDIGGFHQYQANDTVILPMRDSLEGQVINEFNAYGETPPFFFSLSSLTTLPTLDTKSELADLKDIKEVFEHGLETYEHQIPQFKPDEPSEHNKTSIAVAISRGERVGEEVHRTMYRTINDNPQERDEFLWNYLKENLNDSNKTPGANANELKYIMYEPLLTGHDTIAISLNDAGIRIYNTEAERLNAKFIPPNENGTENPRYKDDPEKIATPLPLLIKSKYYRTIDNVQNQGYSNQTFLLAQNELERPFTIESYSMALVRAQCSTGMDPEELPNKEAMEEHPYICGTGETEVHHPRDHGCDGPGEPDCYNKDTGLCNTPIDWCHEMGMGVLVRKTFNGNGAVEYDVCETSGSQEVFSFVISDEGAKYFQRARG